MTRVRNTASGERNWDQFQNWWSTRLKSADPQLNPKAPAHQKKGLLGRSAFRFAITVLATALGSGYAMSDDTVLYRFCSKANCADGQLPVAGLIRDGSGNLFGTTRGGGRGAPGDETGGVVFELQPNGNEAVLHSFAAMPPDGYGAQGTLVLDNSGNLYGTTVWGGANAGFGDGNHSGTIFKIAPNDHNETVLYSFCSQASCADGGYPEGGSLLMDSSGNLYGTTDRHGMNDDAGTVFKLASDGSEATLYSFCSQANCADGRFPEAGLIADSAGNMYATTAYGGGSGACDQGCGTVFRLAPDGTEKVLHAFQGGSDGAHPFASLIADTSGNLYGTTTSGGDANGDGTIFKVAPNGNATVLHAFQGSDGANPYASLIMDRAGNLYGTTQHGGAASCGVVFRLAPNGSETVLYAFQGGNDGCVSTSGLIADGSGNLYGTTINGGGTPDVGTIFELANAIPPVPAQIQPPINADGSSVFSAKRGVVPVIFTLTINGQASCDLPAATISVVRTGSGGGQVDESVYEMQADNGSNFRISDCQWVYNLNSKALGTGTYQISLNGAGVNGTVSFALK